VSDKRIIPQGNALRKSGGLRTSCEFIVDTEKQLVVVKFGRKLGAEAIGQYVERLCAHPSFRRTFSEITDLREAEEVELQAEDFLRLADQIDPFAPESKRAFVVTTSAQSHAARMHKILGTQRNIEIFHSYEEAERWVLS
jgi:hypothetical protein